MTAENHNLLVGVFPSKLGDDISGRLATEPGEPVRSARFSAVPGGLWPRRDVGGHEYLLKARQGRCEGLSQDSGVVGAQFLEGLLAPPAGSVGHDVRSPRSGVLRGLVGEFLDQGPVVEADRRMLDVSDPSVSPPINAYEANVTSQVDDARGLEPEVRRLPDFGPLAEPLDGGAVVVVVPEHVVGGSDLTDSFQVVLYAPGVRNVPCDDDGFWRLLDDSIQESREGSSEAKPRCFQAIYVIEMEVGTPGEFHGREGTTKIFTIGRSFARNGSSMKSLLPTADQKVLVADLDCVVADLLAKWVEWYQLGWDPDFTMKDITEWDFHECVPIKFDIYKYLNADGVFTDLKPIPGAIETLRELHESGKWFIALASSPSKNPNSCGEKHRWVEKYLPFLTRKEVWLGHHKWMLKADAFLEDSPEQITDYRTMWPDAWIGTIAYEYNRNVEGLTNCFAQDYTDFSAAWKTLRQALNTL